MATTSIRHSALAKAGGTKEKKFHIHKHIEGKYWIIRRDGEYGEDFPKFEVLDDAIKTARSMMQEKNIYKLSIHIDNKIILFEEQIKKPKISAMLGSKVEVKSTVSKIKKRPSLGVPNREIEIPKLPGRVTLLNLLV